MEGARIALFEDQPYWHVYIPELLEDTPHRVIVTATSQREALDVLRQIALGDLEIDVVLLDGNLREGKGSGEDSRVLARSMREMGIAARIIGFSLDPLLSYGVYSDVDLTKANASQLPEVLNRL